MSSYRTYITERILNHLDVWYGTKEEISAGKKKDLRRIQRTVRLKKKSGENV